MPPSGRYSGQTQPSKPARSMASSTGAIVDLAGPRLMPSGAVSDLEVLDPAAVRQTPFG